MVTVAENGKEFYGKSTDTKPLHYGSGISIPIPNGAVFIEDELINNCRCQYLFRFLQKNTIHYQELMTQFTPVNIEV